MLHNIEIAFHFAVLQVQIHREVTLPCESSTHSNHNSAGHNLYIFATQYLTHVPSSRRLNEHILHTPPITLPKLHPQPLNQERP